MRDKPSQLDQTVSIEALASLCDVSGRHMRRILDERRVPRAGHGLVNLGAGLRAFLRYTELLSARELVVKWTADPDVQQFLINALIAKWRGFENDISAFANWGDGPPPMLRYGKAPRRVAP